MPVYRDWPVVREGEWHKLQPTLLNSAAPFCVEVVDGPGVGGADRRMNIAKFVMSEFASALPPPVSAAEFVASSGIELKRHPVTADRSFGKISFETPISTLYASAANINRDLFCAFHPKRVIVPSLPLVLKRP